MQKSELIPLQNNQLLIAKAINDATKVIETSISPNSKRALEGDLRYWAGWQKANGLSNDMITKDHIILFIMQHANEMPTSVEQALIEMKVKAKAGLHKISTIERRITSLSTFLNLRKLPNPCQDKDVLMLLRKLTEKFGCSKSWGKAMTLDILNQLLSTCENTLLGVRDRALLLFGFATGGRRRSEISSSVFENLTRNPEGNFVYNLGKSKTNQTGAPDPKPLAGRAALALMHWMEVSNLKEGPIFRGVRKDGKTIYNTPLTDRQISRIIKQRCVLAGLDPTEYTAHSLRSGFVTECGKRGKPIGDVMAMTGHRSFAQVTQYYKPGDIMNNSAAYLSG